MPRSTVCPQCNAQLLLPDEAVHGVWAHCPCCQAVFQLDSAALRSLAEATIVDGPLPEEEPARRDEAAAKRNAVTLADLMPPAEPRVELGDLSDDLHEPLPAEEMPALSTTGWSEGADRLEQLLARVDREATVGTPPADSTSGTGELAGVAEQVVVSSTLGRPRKRSPLRSLVGVVLGGVVGLAAGYYLLLVLGGPEADALRLAQYVPSRLLPASFHSAPTAGETTTPAPPADRPVVAVPQSRESAEVPARFVTPVEPSREMAADDRYATDRVATGAVPSGTPTAESIPIEPPPFDEPAAVPLATAEPHVTGAPSYTIDQLRSALDSARQAKAGLVDGDLSDPAMRRTKGTSYTRFCELAESLTYVEADSASDQLAPLRQESEQLVAQALADAHTRSEVAQIAAIWLTSPNRRSGGVMLAGRVIGRSTLGDVDECQLDTDQGSSLTILLPARSARMLDATGQQVGIIGAIVEAPGKHVSGYTGAAPKAVWVCSVQPLP
jgi:hypothetical protein